MPPKEIVVHPLVLLSVVDHYRRVAKDSKKRVVGVLLGETMKGRLDITNSYAVPFEEDENDPSIWYFDHSYHEQMYRMSRRINAKEAVVGWYSTGPKIKECDLDIHDLLTQYCPDPIFVIIDVQPQELGLPTNAYAVVEQINEADSGKTSKAFLHLPSTVGAFEAEEIGMEHLLRDVKDATISTLHTRIGSKMESLKSLEERLKEIKVYLDLVCEGRLPLNHDITNNLQDVLNLLPNLNVSELVESFTVKSNDMMVVMYLASLVRSIIAIHNLIQNKVVNKETEKSIDAAEMGTAPGPAANALEEGKGEKNGEGKAGEEKKADAAGKK